MSIQLDMPTAETSFCLHTAQDAAKLSNDKLQTGAVIWDLKTKSIIATATGTSIHPELIALKHVSWFNFHPLALILTHSPCAECAFVISHSRIKRVYFQNLLNAAPGLALLKANNIPALRLVYG